MPEWPRVRAQIASRQPRCHREARAFRESQGVGDLLPTNLLSMLRPLSAPTLKWHTREDMPSAEHWPFPGLQAERPFPCRRLCTPPVEVCGFGSNPPCAWLFGG
jgi:hypothetical protein